MNPYETYEAFEEWAAKQGLEFPCTADSFTARVTEYLETVGWNADDFNALMDQGGVQDDD